VKPTQSRITSKTKSAKETENSTEFRQEKKEDSRPRSRIKSALQCIEEIFDIKKENTPQNDPKAITPISKQNNARTETKNNIDIGGKYSDTNTQSNVTPKISSFNNMKVDTKNDDIESMLNNFS